MVTAVVLLIKKATKVTLITFRNISKAKNKTKIEIAVIT